MDTSLLDQIHEIEALESIEEVWPEFEKITHQLGFEYVVYVMANKAGNRFYVIDSAGLHETNDPDFYDPFLEYCCHNYETTFTGAEFMGDYPYLREEAVALIQKAKENGFISGLGIPMRLKGSNRYGGFNLGTGMNRETFLAQFSDKIDSVRLICVMVQRHLEKLMDQNAILIGSEQSAVNTNATDKALLLTERETEVMQYIANGVSRKSCADDLNLSVATVSTHIKNIYRKLEVHNRVDAIRAVTQA